MPHAALRKDRLFGTDGIRGTPGTYPLTDEMLYKIGTGIARFAVEGAVGKKKVSVCIGKDTRLSGGHLETTIARALNIRGVGVVSVGVITTPGLSFLTRYFKADMGIMISASHNKASDNGIKFFNSLGHKLSASEEERIEAIIFDSITHDAPCARGKRKGSLKQVKTAQEIYVRFLTSTIKGLSLKGLSIGLDCAWGAAAPFAKKVFTRLGARVHAIHDKPSGHSINEGGAINPEILKKLVLAKKADIGVAVDGDGDRGIIVDENGASLDGDVTLAIIAKYLLEKQQLPKNTVVATVMSNIGLKICIEENGGRMIITNVGDKYVLEELLKNKLSLGGEQSGHIIFLDYLSTPDGLLTALQILKVMKEKGASVSRLAACMVRYPQILVNVKVREKKPFEAMGSVTERLSAGNARLNNAGRILLRYSGTELLARVMVEGRDKEIITEIAHDLADTIRREIGE